MSASTPSADAVTGAFGYIGRYITRRLLDTGRSVRALTNRPPSDSPFGDRVPALPLDFQDPRRLREALEGVDTLYNTYWVRFPHGAVTFEAAVHNSRTLIQAARDAGVRRIVHVSITNPSEDSPLPYFRGKALVERAIRQSGLPYTILRPTVVFGREDILINNIAWVLRRFPVFTIPGSGEYRLQPVYVDDLAALAVEGARAGDNVVVDAVGPDVLTFNELVRLLAQTVGSRARLVHVPPRVALALSGLLGLLVRDMVLTGDELRGLMMEVLVSAGPPTGVTRLRDWLAANASTIGVAYASELARHYRRRPGPAGTHR